MTYSPDEYDRRVIDFVARQMSPSVAMLIRLELNELKKNMEVHHDSRHHTTFYRLVMAQQLLHEKHLYYVLHRNKQVTFYYCIL